MTERPDRMAFKVSDTEAEIHPLTAHVSNDRPAGAEVFDIAGLMQRATLGQQFQYWVPDLGLGPGACGYFNIECCQVAAVQMARQI